MPNPLLAPLKFPACSTYSPTHCTAPLLLLADYPYHPYLHNEPIFIVQLTLLILLQTWRSRQHSQLLANHHSIIPQNTWICSKWQILRKTATNIHIHLLQYTIMAKKSLHIWLWWNIPQHELQYSCSINVLCFLPLSECEMLYLDLFHILLSGMDYTYSALM
jgi:hypothetical protein